MIEVKAKKLSKDNKTLMKLNLHLLLVLRKSQFLSVELDELLVIAPVKVTYIIS